MKLCRRRTTYLEVEGHRFRVVATPRTQHVDWLTCPSEEFPSGYSSGAYVAANSGFTYWIESLKLMFFGPLPTDEQLRDEIAGWLSFTLSEDGD
ncbi:hypothetical protein [Brevibacterium sp. HMSC063G07]|uniref:hypothetical protein n=1 Tax=Brevibacterium sp. HMSC063G07 TaxID=1739261 RepID=UPI0008A5B1ED|nr:hypothetical protein [Brevibacterium sp. HMSC063G07]OFL64033.1 hypothetical protein HMPREF2757_00780 [Brevibacterium sp. HMSC063G07]